MTSSEPGEDASPPSGIDRETNARVLRELWEIYEEKVLPVERRCFFEHFHTPPISLSEFKAIPQVLLIGQYSTGKTSIAKWLTGVDSSHFDVKPAPSTDKFMAIVHGDEENLIKGDVATCSEHLPYQGLTAFGASFLKSFRVLSLPSQRLKDLCFIDTPGILAGRKQNIGREYEFAKVSAWMAERADLVILAFDAHKLDISDEFQQVMEVLRPFADKVRCVLNKADQIDASNLVRVYGALLWNVGKVLQTPEVVRVYVSSFWNEPYRFQEHKQLFDEDKDAILKELEALPRNTLYRKIDSLAARVRRVKTHLVIVGFIRSRIPWRLRLLGSDQSVREWLRGNLSSLFLEVQRVHGLSDGDMPHLETFSERLNDFEGLLKLPALDRRQLAKLEHVVSSEVPKIYSSVGRSVGAEENIAPAEKPQRLAAWIFGDGAGSARKRPRIA